MTERILKPEKALLATRSLPKPSFLCVPSRALWFAFDFFSFRSSPCLRASVVDFGFLVVATSHGRKSGLDCDPVMLCPLLFPACRLSNCVLRRFVSFFIRVHSRAFAAKWFLISAHQRESADEKLYAAVKGVA